MERFLAIQNTYNQVQMALCINSNLSEIISLDKTVASRECINALEQLLRQNSISLSDLCYIAVNQGPGPFTTLRVVISTVNGLSFARRIPLVGINSLQALAREHNAPYKVVLLNAFAGDVYYLIQADGIQTMGAAKTESVLQLVIEKIPHHPILFLGNGCLVYQQLIKASLGDRALLIEPIPETPSLDAIARMAAQKWHDQKSECYQLQPLYYKQAFIG